MRIWRSSVTGLKSRVTTEDQRTFDITCRQDKDEIIAEAEI